MSPSFSCSIAEQVPTQFGVQAAALFGNQVGGSTITCSTYYTSASVDAFGDVYVAAIVPITVFYGTSANAQVLVSWWDPFGRPRKLSGLDGAAINVTAAETGIVCFWASTKVQYV